MEDHMDKQVSCTIKENCLFTTSARKQNPYNTKEMRDFHNFKETAGQLKNFETDVNGDRIKWMNINEICIQKVNPHIVMFKYWHDQEEYLTFDLFNRLRGPVPTLSAPPLQKTCPISAQKLKDLKYLVDRGVIPSTYHQFYRNLPCSGQNSNDSDEMTE